jgi:NAD(P)H-hydrate epimerase
MNTPPDEERAVSQEDSDSRFEYLTPAASTRDTIRNWDEIAIRDYGIPGLVLMENAGEACVRVLVELLEQKASGVRAPIHMVCGPGNNGGDGLVIARHLFNRGVESRVFLTAPCASMRPGSDAETQLRIVKNMGIPLHEPGDETTQDGETQPSQETLEAARNAGTFVDAMFGTGLSRPLGTATRAWVDAMNDSEAAIVAIDIPSGLHADTGEILGVAVRAQWTLTFVASKVGFEREKGPQCTGEVRVLGISIPRQELE